VDPSKSEKLLNWRPEVDLEAGLKETLRFFGAI
jgi:UDP-glucose 4-epimerase